MTAGLNVAMAIVASMAGVVYVQTGATAMGFAYIWDLQLGTLHWLAYETEKVLF